MKKFLNLAALVAFALVAAGCPWYPQDNGYEVVFEDNFDTLSPTWQPSPFGTLLPPTVEGGTVTLTSTTANGEAWGHIAASIIAPKPVPAPPATAREIAADELRVAEQHGYGSADIGPTAVADRIIDRLTVAGLLVEAPTGDDEPPPFNWLDETCGCGTPNCEQWPDPPGGDVSSPGSRR